MKQTPLQCIAVIATVSLSMLANIQASLLVYEDFTYSLSSGTSMNGVAADATGLTGNYSAATSGVSGTGSGSATYTTMGLTFSSNFQPTTGGALSIATFGGNTGGGNAAVEIAGVRLNTGTQTGTLYSSYLINITFNQNGNSNTSTRLNSGATESTTTNARFMSYSVSNDAQKTGIAYDNTTSSGSGIKLTGGTTYLVINRFTNVGSALSTGTPGVATTWYLTTSQYNNWMLAGGLESNLGTYATVTLSDSVTSGTYGFGNSNYVQFTGYSGNNSANSTQTVIYDELRWATTFNEVAIPEPSAFALMVAGCGLVMLLRRRNRVSFRMTQACRK